MFECRACVVRCIRAIAGDAFKGQTLTRRRLLLTPLLSNRRYASTALATKHDFDPPLIPGQQPMDEDAEDGTSTAKTALTLSEKRALELELKYLGDRLKFAEHIRYTLRSNKPTKALQLCRLASREQEVIVAWNHCVDWHMQNGKIDDAIKIYNEMKKRAQFPDSHTYVLLLRGLAKKHHHGQVVKDSNVTKAVSIYNSLSAPNSKVKPSIIHTNAVLTVCSAALDMDALWGVASKMPSSGPNAADTKTYTIILTALRHGAFGNVEGQHPDMIAKSRNRVVQDGRRIWQEVIPKWRGGEVHIDEELVCAMGRLLLLSKRMQDWDDVLSLVKQTMNIGRLIPPLGHPDRNTEHVPQEHDYAQPDEEPEEDSEGYTDTPLQKAFNPIKPLPPSSAHPNAPASLIWVQPGNPTLSLLIEACTLLRTPKTATAYWDLFTTHYTHTFEPDLANFHSHLKLLSKNRSSSRTAKLLSEDMPAAGVEPKNQTFRIAMGTCVRDKNNPHVLEHARTIIDVMEATTPDPDIHTLIQYLQLSLTTDDGKKIANVLDRLDPIVHNLRSLLAFGTEEGVTKSDGTEKEQIIIFFQTMVGVIDTLLNRGLVPREEYNHWHGRRSQLTQVIGRGKAGLERQRGRLERVGLGVGGRDGAGTGGSGMRDGRSGSGMRDGRSEMRMSRTEWALKVFRRGERREGEREGNRLKAVGVRGWHVGMAKEGARGGRGAREGREFADSPMELGVR